MQNFILRDYSDLTINHIGKEECGPGHLCSWQFKKNYLIHYIVSGSGTFTTENRTYSLEVGNAFFIGNKKGLYRADENDPWTYIWINFSGALGKEFLEILKLDSENPIYKTNNPERLAGCFEEMAEIDTEKNEFYIYSRFLNLMSEMLETSSSKTARKKPAPDRYIDICREYVRLNYMKKITAKDLSKAAMLEYSYLFRLFKEKLGMSPGEYIINFKIGIAAKLLCEDDMTINEIAATVGYDDRAAFSKLFRKKCGISPSEYRKNT